ncbi:hypothetical protein CK203_019999 [Vitis vinifera]|uniref:DDE Tnp4 domain-containing protein n=1 Tax=Vitis vinifera TaxID=29760 RepID=A0A438J2Q5_VITVI|nr:hypothetical protein CK203_019999 [Vitis vinifera]
MDDNNTSSGSLCESTSSSEEDDDLDEIFIAYIMNEYEEIFLCKTPQRTSMLSGHNVRMKVVVDCFQHSTETVTQHFKEVKRVLRRLGRVLIRLNNMTNAVSSYVASNLKYFPWLKDCIGAIDGTHISAWVLADIQTNFRETCTTSRQELRGVVISKSTRRRVTHQVVHVKVRTKAYFDHPTIPRTTKLTTTPPCLRATPSALSPTHPSSLGVSNDDLGWTYLVGSFLMM